MPALNSSVHRAETNSAAERVTVVTFLCASGHLNNVLCFWSQAAEPALAVPRNGCQLVSQAHTWNIWRTFLRGRLTFSLCISWWISSMFSSPSPFLSASWKVCFTQLPACQGQAHRALPTGSRQGSSGKNPFAPALATAQPNA